MVSGNGKRRKLAPLLVLGSTLIGAAAGIALSWQWAEPGSREVVIGARQYAYDPPVIHVAAGDTLSIRLVSLDVVHGLYFEGHDLDARIYPQQKTFLVRHPSTGEEWSEVDRVTLIAGRPGKYRYRCSHTCGSMHPFMQGELVVEPNLPFRGGIGALVGLFAGMIMKTLVESRTSSEDEEGAPRGA
jgi:heme/copper-type cytochrome/quinol oxidase subunit 2